MFRRMRKMWDNFMTAIYWKTSSGRWDRREIEVDLSIAFIFVAVVVVVVIYAT